MLEGFMDHNEDIYILLGGLGYPRVDELIAKYPDRAINCEASEQTMLDMAVGLAYAGKIPICYTITPFYLRGFETIRTYINHEKHHIILIGAGRNTDYSKDDGYSHDACDIGTILGTQLSIKQYYPLDKLTLMVCLKSALYTNKDHATFISLKR